MEPVAYYASYFETVFQSKRKLSEREGKERTELGAAIWASREIGYKCVIVFRAFSRINYCFDGC
jgi:hypothetical protein